MTSFIISSKNKTKRDEYALSYCRKLDINVFDITVIRKETAVKQNVQSIGIDEIKNFQKRIFLKPIKSKTKAVILEDAHFLTIEAQNAMLKILEEPPVNTIILLTVESEESLLPTIISRCSVVAIERDEIVLSDKETGEYMLFLKSLPKLTVGERLKKAESLAKDKESSLAWLEKFIVALREKMLDEEIKSSKSSNSAFQSLKSFQELYILLKTTNVNLRFAWENTLLSL